jgi:NAD(P)-dependent dehydrogenase (short-subunit alcohol dehydrogenase family)
VDTEKLEHIKLRLQGRAEVLAGDISASDYGEKLAAALAGRQVAALIHCAGLSGTMASAERILEVNLAATMRLVDTVLPRMANESCAVLFSSSGAYFLGSGMDDAIGKVLTAEAVPELLPLINGTGSAYTVSKRAVKLLVERVSPAFGARGARIVSISPGIIDTPMARGQMEEAPMMHDLIRNSALSRMAKAEEVAAVALFLCTPAASFISGTDILVDGGMIAGNVGAARNRQ